MPFQLFVNGTLMHGFALHKNLEGALFLGQARTEPCYRVHTIDDRHPGMYRLEESEAGGISVPGELYLITEEQWEVVEAGEPPNLYCGPVMLDDGRTVMGILYPRALAEGVHPDISSYGGWRAYWEARQESVGTSAEELAP